jgi:hypothetical protein
VCAACAENYDCFDSDPATLNICEHAGKCNAACVVPKAKVFDGGDSDIGYFITPTSGGGYVVAGVTSDLSDYKIDTWVLKFDASLNKIWDTKLKDPIGIGVAPVAIQQAPDGGYFIAGRWANGLSSSVVFKLDSSSNESWRFTIPLSNENNYIFDIVPTSDGGCMAIISGDVSKLIKLDSSGNQEWEKDSDPDKVRVAITASSDGNYIIAGFNATDSIIEKVDISGAVLWEKPLAPIDFYTGYYAKLDRYYFKLASFPAGGYLIQYPNNSRKGVWIKTDNDGNKIWQITSDNEFHPIDVAVTADGGFVALSDERTAQSLDRWVYIPFIIKFDSDGNVIWSYTLDGQTFYYSIKAIQEVPGVGYIVTGSVNSDGTTGSNGMDIYVAIIDAEGRVIYTNNAAGGAGLMYAGAGASEQKAAITADTGFAREESGQSDFTAAAPRRIPEHQGGLIERFRVAVAQLLHGARHANLLSHGGGATFVFLEEAALPQRDGTEFLAATIE